MPEIPPWLWMCGCWWAPGWSHLPRHLSFLSPLIFLFAARSHTRTSRRPRRRWCSRRRREFPRGYTCEREREEGWAGDVWEQPLQPVDFPLLFLSYWLSCCKFPLSSFGTPLNPRTVTIFFYKQILEIGWFIKIESLVQVPSVWTDWSS